MKKKTRNRIVEYFFKSVSSPHSSLLRCLDDIENAAKVNLNESKWLLFNDTAGKGYTATENINAFQRYSLMPKALKDVSKFSYKTKILNKQIQFPIGMAPINTLCMVHADGDIISAQLAQELGTVFIHSAHAQTTIQDIAAAAPDAIKWLQVYLYNPLEITMELVKMAEEHGYSAIVITIDKPVPALKHNNKHYLNIQPKYFPNIQLISKKLGLDLDHPKDLSNPTQSWDQAKEVQKHTKLPIVLKGILNKDDVKLASNIGAKAVIVSNHGGR
jgi:(S)-2-hydroxy-acid oxidase